MWLQVAYDTGWSTVVWPAVSAVIERFSRTLKVYGHSGLGPRRYRSASFDDRADMALVALVRRCHLLSRLVIRDRVSTATLIVIAAEGSLRVTSIAVKRPKSITPVTPYCGLVTRMSPTCQWQVRNKLATSV